MIYVDKPAKEWAKQHKIGTLQMLCHDCKQIKELDVPVLMSTENGRKYAGLCMSDHGCFRLGSGPGVFVPCSEKSIQYWSGIL